MGRTVPTMTQLVQSEEDLWAPFRRALRAEDRVAFDRLFAAARHYAAVASYAARPAPLRQAAALLGDAAPRRGVREPVTVRPTKRQDLLQGEIEVVEVTVADPLAFPRLVARLARIDGLTFYNCDIALPQMYLYERRLFPLGRCAVEATPEGTIREIAPLESPWEAEYTVPPLMILRLRLDGDPANPNHGHRAVLHVGVDGEEGGLVGETPAD